MSKLLSCLSVFVMVLAACGQQADQSVADSVDDPEFTPPVLATVIEPADILLLDFGDGWSMTDRWNIEDVFAASVERDAAFESTCLEYNELQKINRDAIYTTLWENGQIQMSQTVAGLGRDAETYVDNALRLPTTCPEVELSEIVLSFQAVDLDIPNSVAHTQSAYPNLMSLIAPSVPALLDGLKTWTVYAYRGNVVSRLIVAGDGIDEDAVAALARTMVTTLENAESDEIERPPRSAPPSTVPVGTRAEGVTLTFDTVTCRNDGGVEAAGIWWQLNEGVPTEWRATGGEITGNLTMSGELATFTAPDGNEVELTSGFRELDCPLWPNP